MKGVQIYMIGMSLFFGVHTQGFSQIDTTNSASFLVERILLGAGVLAGNVTFTGENHAIGIYEDSTSQIGIEKGIVLTSGNAFYTLGPNKTPRSGWASNAPGDEELDKIARGKTYDAAVLEFDFVTSSENLSFEFVFASEEYLEYVGSKFNDVFAFFITGPDKKKVNIAKLPDGITPITVNTVNHEMNQQYYINNAYINTTDPFVWDVRNRKVINNEYYLQDEIPPEYFTQFDGFTTVLTARATVIPNEVYHIKIALADVGDGILDSGVYLKAGSFKSSGDQQVEIDKFFAKNTPAKALEKKAGQLALKDEKPRVELKAHINLANVEFEFDEANLTKNGTLVLSQVYEKWSEQPDKIIQIKGHTDNYGSDAYNIKLSEKRASAVETALLNMGVPKDKLQIAFYGEKMPISTNDNDFGRARNRRVEFSLVN